EVANGHAGRRCSAVIFEHQRGRDSGIARCHHHGKGRSSADGKGRVTRSHGEEGGDEEGRGECGGEANQPRSDSQRWPDGSAHGATTYLVGLTEQQQHTNATAARNGAPYICAPKGLQWPHLVNGPLATPDPADNLSHRALTSHQPVPPLWER